MEFDTATVIGVGTGNTNALQAIQGARVNKASLLAAPLNAFISATPYVVGATAYAFAALGVLDADTQSAITLN